MGRFRTSPIVSLMFLVVAWGGNYTWVKLALEDGGPWTFNAMRNVLAATMLGLFLWHRRGFRHVLPIRNERFPACLVGILQIGVMTGGTTLALQYIDASRTVLIAYSMPLWSAVLSFLFLNEQASRSMLIALVCGFAGIAALAAPWSMDWTGFGPLLGSCIALLATIGWASGSILHRSRAWRSDLWQLVFAQLLAGAVFSLIAAVVFEAQTASLTPAFVTIVLCSAIGPTILGFWFWARALRQLSVTTASQALLLSPLFGIWLSSVVLGEHLTWSILISAVLILTAVLISFQERSKAASA